MSVVVCYAQNHIFAKGKWRWNMPEATGVLPESAKIDSSGPCFGTPFCSFGLEFGKSAIKKIRIGSYLSVALRAIPPCGCILVWIDDVDHQRLDSFRSRSNANGRCFRNHVCLLDKHHQIAWFRYCIEY